MDAVLRNATFSEPACADDANDMSITVVSEVSMPRAVVLRKYVGDSTASVHSHIESVLVAAVSSGLLSDQIQVSSKPCTVLDE